MQHRVLFDFEVAFANGGDLRGRDFRLDIAGDCIGEEALARQLVDDLHLLMVDSVDVSNVRIIDEPHRRVEAAAGASR